MEFDLGADGSLTPLPKQNIDTGMGLERGAMLAPGRRLDLRHRRLPADHGLDRARSPGVGYGTSPEATKAHRVLSDHGRGVTFLVAEGVTPSNEGRGYVLRRLIRRSVVQARRIGLAAVYPLPRDRRRAGRAVVPGGRRERGRDRAGRARRGGALPRDARPRHEGVRGARGQADIGAADAFRLAATYGFPIELTVELARERGHTVDVDGYRVEMERHREISRGTGREGPRPARGGLRRRRPASRPSSSATRRSTSSRSSVRSRSSATGRSSRSSASRRSTRRAAARSPTTAGSSSTTTRRCARSSSTRTASTATRCSLFRGDGLRGRRPRAGASSRGASGSRRWRTTPRRTSCRRRSARCSASTSSRRARPCGRTSCASTSRTARS